MPFIGRRRIVYWRLARRVYTEPMKALKIIGLILLILVAVGGIALGGFYLGTAQERQNTSNAANNTNSNNSNNTPNTPVKPTKETTCNADELRLTTATGDAGGAGTLTLNLILTNIGDRECIQGGFPGVSLVDANGNMIGSPADRATNYTEKTFSLKPGDAVFAELSYEEAGNFDAGVCKDGATKLRVYAPNDTGYLSIAETAIPQWCPGFEVSPVLQ